MSVQTIMPDSRLSNAGTARNAVLRNGTYWEWIYCASCAKRGGMVPTENITSVAWICVDCEAKHPGTLDACTMPDHVFFELVKMEQTEKYGRALTATEIVNALADPDSLESRLAAERKFLTPSASK